MEPQSRVPYGRRVRLTQDFKPDAGLNIQSGDSIFIEQGKMQIERSKNRLERPAIPAGTCGTVDQGPYGGGCYIHEIECPVNWDFKHPTIATYTGTPWEFIELVD